MEQHPTRQELIKAAQAKRNRLIDHIEQCVDCRSLYELFRAFPVTGEIELAEAPAGWIVKAKEIANASGAWATLKGIAAKLSFDSWALPAAVGVRSQTVERDRRLQFEVGPMHLDIRAEQQTKVWEYTARITSEQVPTDGIVLTVDRRAVPADSLGFYHWTSPKPPKQIRLSAGEIRIDLPEMTWIQKPQK